MPVWRIQHDRMKVGTQVLGVDPPMWVAEVKRAPSMRDQVSNGCIREHHKWHPERTPIPLVSEKLRWWHRLVGAQLSLLDV